MSGSDTLTGPAIIAAVKQGQDRMEQDRKGQDTYIIALVGAGDQGLAILRALLGVPGVEVRYVFDSDPVAPGVALARDNGIRCRTDGRFDELTGDGEVDLVLETGGDADVLAVLAASTHPDSCLIGAAGTRFIAHLLAEIDAVGERANLEKARYLRQASHQVKSPLSSIQSYVNVILGGYTGEIPERTRDIVEKIHSRCDAALGALAKRRMLADLRCVDGDGLEMSTVRLGEVIDEAVARHAEAAARRDIELRVLPHGRPARVDCDPQKMVALLSELVENAVIYSHDGGLVEIALTSLSDGRLTLSIRDHGIGIPERCLPRIFDEDYRADLAVKHHQDGAGLGLAIAREIAGLHRFGLTAESEEGHGSVFTVTVPEAPTA
jgi:signal transduction histidine kinase